MTEQTQSNLQQWVSLPDGFRFPSREVRIPRTRQLAYHRFCDVAEAPFGEIANSSIFAQDAAKSALEAGLPLDGRIHLYQAVEQSEPVALDTPLQLEGALAPFRRTSRGTLLTCVHRLRRADGAVPLTLTASFLLPAVEHEAPPAEAPPAVPAGPWTRLGGMALSSAKVCGYSLEVGNLIHFDTEFAAARGFATPLAQGLMAVTALQGAAAPVRERFLLEVWFRRPMFWEDSIELLAGDGGRLLCRGPQGRDCALGRLSEPTRPVS